MICGRVVMVHTLYVLKLRHGKFYVGTTGKLLRRRVEEHKCGAGATWTRKHPVMHVHESTPVSKEEAGFREDAEVQRLMQLHGIEAVRGGTYSRTVLPRAQLRELRGKIWHNQGRCLRCGRGGHTIKTCYARTTIDGDEPFDESESESSDDGGYRCFRCGREGHMANACYARTDVDGNML